MNENEKCFVSVIFKAYNFSKPQPNRLKLWYNVAKIVLNIINKWKYTKFESR